MEKEADGNPYLQYEDDGSDGASGSPDQINDDGVEPDFKVEDEYDVNFGDLDEEISKLIKPELLSSETSLGLYSTTPSPLSKREPTPAISAKTEQKSSEPQELAERNCPPREELLELERA